jgi:hypothetical protein
MPRTPSLNAKVLLALGPERLVELLLELAEGDPAIKRQLKLAVATGTSARDGAAQVRQRLDTIQRSRTFLEHDKRRAMVKELTTHLEAITGPIAKAEPAIALVVLWDFLALGANVLGRCDDSGGMVGELFREAMRRLGPLATAVRPEPLALAEQTFAAYCDNGYGVYDMVIETLAPALGADGLADLQRRFEALAAEPVPVPPRQEWKAVGWGPGGATYAHEREERSRQWTVKAGLQAVAEASGDVDGVIAQYTEKQQRFPRIATELAERLLAAGRPDEALRFLVEGAPNPNSWPEMAWEATHIKALEAVGRAEEAQQARWNCFARCLDSEVLRAYLAHCPAFEDVEAEERAIALAMAYPNLLQSLAFLLFWPPALGRAAELVVRRRAELHGDHYDLLSPGSEKLSANHPLAATLLLRAMVAFTLTYARSSRYGHAARHLQSCALLSRRISDWGDIPTHDVYLAGLRSDHARKSGFWGKMRQLGME